MVNRLVSVGDDFTLPDAVKVEDTNLPARLGAGELNATFASVRNAEITAAVARSPFRGQRPVAYHTGMAGNQVDLSNGTDTGQNSRVRHDTTGAVSHASLVFTNWIGRNGLAEVNGPNAITIRAAIEKADGTFVPVFFRGVRDVVIEPGATVQSDSAPLNIGASDTNKYFFTRNYVTVASVGMKWPIAVSTSTGIAGEGAVSGTSTTDLTTSGTITALTSRVIGPSLIVGGGGATLKRTIGIVGDSIGTGTRDTFEDRGPFPIAFQPAGVPIAKITSAGETFANSAASTTYRRWMMVSGATDVICQLGVNDLRSVSPGLAATQASALKVWNILAGQGARVWQTTVTPTNTSSTDNWATTAGQTINVPAAHAIRNSFNAWVRDGAPAIGGVAAAAGTTDPTAVRVLAGYIEFADAIETARDSGIFKAGLSYDGLHPTPAGHAALAAAIDVALFQ